VREGIETLNPSSARPFEETDLKLYGAEPIHGGQALVGEFTKFLKNQSVNCDPAAHWPAERLRGHTLEP
jgi:hypothetical protein